MRTETDIILEARDIGILPASVTLDVSRTNVTISMPRFGPVDFAAQDRALEWFRKAFGEAKPSKYRYCAYRGQRHHPAADRVDYRAATENGLIQIHAFAPHEHGDYRGEIRNGQPRWICGGCRKPITKTAARKLGLLP
jgi:hypothetical protein